LLVRTLPNASFNSSSFRTRKARSLVILRRSATTSTGSRRATSRPTLSRRPRTQRSQRRNQPAFDHRRPRAIRQHRREERLSTQDRPLWTRRHRIRLPSRPVMCRNRRYGRTVGRATCSPAVSVQPRRAPAASSSSARCAPRPSRHGLDATDADAPLCVLCRAASSTQRSTPRSTGIGYVCREVVARAHSWAVTDRCGCGVRSDPARLDIRPAGRSTRAGLERSGRSMAQKQASVAIIDESG
jgi:hypothetical protein